MWTRGGLTQGVSAHSYAHKCGLSRTKSVFKGVCVGSHSGRAVDGGDVSSRPEGTARCDLGKSAKNAGGVINLLLAHLLDTAAVAEVMWDRFLCPMTQARLDHIAQQPGKAIVLWMCGIHDCGKVTPAFQSLDDQAAAAVKASGLTWTVPRAKLRWRHEKAGGWSPWKRAVACFLLIR